MRTIDAALVLPIVALVGLLTARIDGLARCRGLAGWSRWADSVSGRTPRPRTSCPIPNRRGGIRSCSRGWSQSARSCSASAGSDHVRSHAARLRWCSSPDYALVRMAGFTAILLYGVGWAWLGYRVSRLSTVG